MIKQNNTMPKLWSVKKSFKEILIQCDCCGLSDKITVPTEINVRKGHKHLCVLQLPHPYYTPQSIEFSVWLLQTKNKAHFPTLEHNYPLYEGVFKPELF